MSISVDPIPPAGVPLNWYREMLAELGDGPIPKGSSRKIQQLEQVAAWEWFRIAGLAPEFDGGDCLYFLHNYVKILHPEHGIIPFHLRPAQIQALNDIEATQQLLILKARQIGWTTLIEGDSLHKALTRPHWFQIVLSKTEDDAAAALGMAKFMWDSVPEWLKSVMPHQNTKHTYKLGFSNGSLIEAHPSKNSPARSRSPKRIVADEFAFFDNQDTAWPAMLPAAKTGGQIIVLSTANGYGDTFEAQVQRARANASNFKFLFFGWKSDPTRGPGWRDDVARDMEPWQVYQEYPDTPEEAFLRSGNLRFDPDVIEAWPKERGRVGIIGYHGLEVLDGIDGYLEVWEEPVPGAVYVIGADVAEGLEHGDWSVAQVLRKHTGRHVASIRLKTTEPADFAVHLDRLGRWYNRALLGVERNNHGHTVLNELKRHLRYPRLYYQTAYDERTRRQTQAMGWLTSKKTKSLMIDSMWQAMRSDIVYSHAARLHGEMKAYRRNPDGTTSGQPHDDEVMSMAIAVQMLQHVGMDVIEKATPTTKHPSPFSHENTFDSWRDLIARKELAGVGAPYRSTGVTSPDRGMPRRLT